jgi:hypothetical protein
MQKFESKYVSSTLRILEKRCLILLCESYFSLKTKNIITIDSDEENISKELIINLENNENKLNWKITVIPEFRIYKADNTPAQKAPRIDFCFSCWMSQEWQYFVEAKNLIETDASKKGKKSKISAKHLHKRYVETGIDNYLSGRYPSNACLVGYILQGKTENIIGCINQHLQNCSREPEILVGQCFELPNFDSSYLSKHKNDITIKHLMFDFTVNK